MAILLTSKTVRVMLNAGSSGGFIDQLTKAPVKFPKADLRIEAALFYGRVNATLSLVDLSNIVSITCTVKAVGSDDGAPDPSTANLMQSTVLAAAMNPALTSLQWDALTHQHAAFDFTEAEVNVLQKGNVWVVFTALLANGKVIPIQFGVMEVVEDGYASAGTTAAAQNTSYTKAESNALYLSGLADGETAKCGTAALVNGAQNGAVAFATAFSAAPAQVLATVEMPDGNGGVLAASVHTLTAAGFSYVLTADAPAAGYKLHWRAIL